MNWRCWYIDANGNRCDEDAIRRIHFASQHPFDHMDLCKEHLKEYKNFVWCEDLEVVQ